MSARAIAVGVVVLVSNCPAGPTACRARDREADHLQARGKQLLDRKKLDEARAALEPALARHAAVEDHTAASLDASLLSEVYQKVNDYRAALLMAERARIAAMASGQSAPLARALVAQGMTLQRLGDRERARAAYDEAEPHLPEDDLEGRSRVAIYRASNLRAQGRRAAAQELLERGRDLAARAGAVGLLVGACVNLSDMAIAENRPDDADRHLRCARDASRARGDARPSAVILCNQAHVARLRGDLAAADALLDQVAGADSPDTARAVAECRGAIALAAGRHDAAERHYEEAVRIIEKLRAEAAPADTKGHFLEQRWEAYENLFALRLRRGDARGAFTTLALAQGRMFFEALAVSLAETRPAASTRTAAALDRMETLQRVLPRLADSVLAVEVAPAEALVALRGRHVLIYFAAAGRMSMLAVADGEPRATGVSVELDQLDRLVDDFLARPHHGAAAEALAAALLPPGALPAAPARLHIVPTGPLLRVPFAALRLSGARLIDRYELVYAPSATGLAAMTRARPVAMGAGAVVADTRSDLRHADSEVASVVAHTRATAYTGARATVAALRAAARRPLLHVVSHSGLGAEGGFLALADGKVSAADIVDWRVGPDLAVLPTCWSTATSGREMWGSLAAGFLAAGSRHVVATVASVEDAVGFDFTRRFYAAGGARDPIGAAARAQRAMAAGDPDGGWWSFVVAGL